MRLTLAKLCSMGILVMVAMASVGMVACGGSDSTKTNDIPCTFTEECPLGQICSDAGVCTKVVPCMAHEDCGKCNSCNLELMYCVSDESACTDCAGDSDCPANYICRVEKGYCIPDGTVVDGDEEEQTTDETCGADKPCSLDVVNCHGGERICVSATSKCACKYPSCKDDTECWPGTICDTVAGFCKDKPVVDGDAEVEPEPDAEPEVETNTCVGGARSCQRTSDCSDAAKVCGAGGCCIDKCTDSSCTNGASCNPNNGLCEYCGLNGGTDCPDSQCCNYAGDFWYCGSCCTPPCADGTACQAGTCVPLTCPTTCGADRCCDAAHGYACYDCVDGDVDVEYRNATCKPANSTCRDGVDVCCSGTCLMGTCL